MASAYSPAAVPAAANEPVSSFVRSTNTNPSAVAGTRARMAVANSRREPDTRRTVSTRPRLRPAPRYAKGFGEARIHAVRSAS